MRKLTEAAVRDSAGVISITHQLLLDAHDHCITAMKQISYLTMFFLPASFAAVRFNSVYPIYKLLTHPEVRLWHESQYLVGRNARHPRPLLHLRRTTDHSNNLVNHGVTVPQEGPEPPHPR
jgi:hypothetical protein